MSYGLGVDLGTTYSAAARYRGGVAEMISLGHRSTVVPSAVLVTQEGEFLVGEAAMRRGATEPERLAREFKRRIGDSVPVILGGTPLSAEALSARLLRWIVDQATQQEGEPPEQVALTYPANWGLFKQELLAQVIRLAEVGRAVTLTEPDAAAISYAATERVRPGEVIAVYDLGGGTFDSAILRKTAEGFELLGDPEGIERRGGVDFDEAVFAHVNRALDGELDRLPVDDPIVTQAVSRLRQDCIEAKEALSSDTDVSIAVVLPHLSTEVRLTRGELESMVRPVLEETVDALRRTITSAGLTPEKIDRVLLVGGSSRMPLVGQMVAESLGRPFFVDAHPKYAVALGAARMVGEAWTTAIVPAVQIEPGWDRPGAAGAVAAGAAAAGAGAAAAGAAAAASAPAPPLAEPVGPARPLAAPGPPTTPGSPSGPPTMPSGPPTQPTPPPPAPPPPAPPPRVRPEAPRPDGARERRIRQGGAAAAILALAAVIVVAVVALTRDDGGNGDNPPPDDGQTTTTEPTEPGQAPTVALAGTTPVGATPDGLAVEGDHVWVASTDAGGQGADDLAQLDLATGEVLNTYLVGGEPIGLVVGEGSLWVARRAAGEVARLDLATGDEIATVETPGNPHDLAFGAGAVWVAAADGILYRIDPADNSVQTVNDQLTEDLSSVAATEDAVYVSYGIDPGTVAEIDPATLGIVHSVEVGGNVDDLAVGDSGIWVARRTDALATRIDPESFEITAEVAVGQEPAGIAIDGDRVWVINRTSGDLTLIDGPNATVLATTALGTRPLTVVTSPDRVWVSLSGDNTVARVDVSG